MNKTSIFTLLSLAAVLCALPAGAAPHHGRQPERPNHGRGYRPQQPARVVVAPRPAHVAVVPQAAHVAVVPQAAHVAVVPQAGLTFQLGKHLGISVSLPVVQSAPAGYWVNRETRVWVEGFWTETRTANGRVTGRVWTDGYWKTVVEPEWVVAYNR